MGDDTIDKVNVLEACWSKQDSLCVKVASRDGVRMVNSYKKYLAVESHCDDFVPPVLEQHEDILIQYGNKLRAG